MEGKTHILILFVFAGLLLGLSSDASAQRSKHRLGNEKFQQLDYRKAAEIYEDILKKSPDDPVALQRAAESRMRIDDFEISEAHYLALSKHEACRPEDLIAFADVLKINKKYDEAVMVYERYLSYAPDPYLLGYIDNDWAMRILRDSARFDVRNMPINSPQSDFAPSFSEDGILFSSSRRQGKGKRKTYTWTDQSYLNLFKAEIAPDSSLVSAKVLKGKANSRFHEGTVTYDKSQKIMYFTSNNHFKGKRNSSDEGYLNLGIYYATYEGEKMEGKLKAFPFNDPAYSVGHPAISPDGKAMYFVSDMPGGSGGTDIYVSYRNLDFWGEPINLGPRINTPGNEMFPFQDGQETFYFASDYHPGLGGLDMFYTRLDDEESKIRNFGYPINSSFDDFGLITYSDGLKGYFSSNRPGGAGDDDIYLFVVNKPEKIQVSGRAFDVATGSPIPNATILLKDSQNETVLEVVANTDADGNYRFDVDYDQSYILIGVKNAYFQNEIRIHSSDKSGYLDQADIGLTAYDYAAEGTVVLADSGEKAVGATVLLKTIDGEVLQELLVDEDGKYHFGLDPEMQYVVEAFKAGYPPQSIELDTRGKAATIINSDLSLFAYEAGAVVRLDNIYYDYDKFNIRADAARELDRLVEILTGNPTMRIELSSHTDARGSDPYNLRLSQKRADAAVAYLISQGIEASRLVARGYGETKLLNDCGNGVTCTEAEHQRNRRTEFTILNL